MSLSGCSEEAVNREADAPGPADADPDVLVVGGGTAGAVVAGRLVEAGLRVQVLEAGSDYGTLSGSRVVSRARNRPTS